MSATKLSKVGLMGDIARELEWDDLFTKFAAAGWSSRAIMFEVGLLPQTMRTELERKFEADVLRPLLQSLPDVEQLRIKAALEARLKVEQARPPHTVFDASKMPAQYVTLPSRLRHRPCQLSANCPHPVAYTLHMSDFARVKKNPVTDLPVPQTYTCQVDMCEQCRNRFEKDKCDFFKLFTPLDQGPPHVLEKPGVYKCNFTNGQMTYYEEGVARSIYWDHEMYIVEHFDHFEFGALWGRCALNEQYAFIKVTSKSDVDEFSALVPQEPKLAEAIFAALSPFWTIGVSWFTITPSQ